LPTACTSAETPAAARSGASGYGTEVMIDGVAQPVPNDEYHYHATATFPYIPGC